MNRTERERRIAKDDGDPAETVYGLPRCLSGDGGYHDDPNCRYLRDPERIRSLPRSKAQRRTMPPCKECVLDEVERDHHGNDGPWRHLQRIDTEGAADG